MRGDPVRVIEAAYALEADNATWMKGVLEATAPLLRPAGCIGLTAWLYDHRSLDTPLVDGYCTLDASPVLAQTVYDVNLIARRGLIAKAHRMSFGRSLSIASTSDLLPRQAYDEWWIPFMRRGLDAEPAHRQPVDFLAINAIREPHVGLMVGAVTTRYSPPDAAQRALWPHLCAHLATAMRLRHRLATRGGSREPDADEAIVSVNGRVEHATGRAKQRRVTDDLIAAARAIDRARGSLRGQNAAAAVEIWRALVQGDWSLVDYAVEGNRRYLVAKQNAVPTPPETRLSDRQRQILHYACQGHSNKLIAYELGLSPATIATHLQRAARQLGVGSRQALIARCYPLFVDGRLADDGEEA